MKNKSGNIYVRKVAMIAPLPVETTCLYSHSRL